MIITKIVQHLRRDDFCCAFANYLLMFVFYPTKTCRTPCFDCSADEVRLLSISSTISPWSLIIVARSRNTVCTWFISVDNARISSWRSRIIKSLYCKFALLGFTLTSSPLQIPTYWTYPPLLLYPKTQIDYDYTPSITLLHCLRGICLHEVLSLCNDRLDLLCLEFLVTSQLW